MKAHYIDRRGQAVDDDEATDENGILRDGYGFRVPTMVTDAANRQFLIDSFPFAPVADAAAREKLLDAYERREARLQNAWKEEPATAAVAARHIAATIQQIASSGGGGSRARRDRRLEDAWRDPR